MIIIENIGGSVISFAGFCNISGLFWTIGFMSEIYEAIADWCNDENLDPQKLLSVTETERGCDAIFL
ncbi:hypothetical protein Leryth_005614 [Lithospermum erythrorhizon]|nr:hypothetical protein Leryth_005614 [Lithospermum erythrorhizon]